MTPLLALACFALVLLIVVAWLVWGLKDERR